MSGENLTAVNGSDWEEENGRGRGGVGEGVAGDESIMLRQVEETRRSLATCACLATDSNISGVPD